MSKNKVVGVLMIVLSLVLFIIYTYLVYFVDEKISFIVIKTTVYLSVVVLIVAFIYVGYALIKTPSIPPEELEKIIDEILKEENQQNNTSSKK